MRLLIVDDDRARAASIFSLLPDADRTTSCVAVRSAEAETAIISGTYDAYLIACKPGTSDCITLIECTGKTATVPFVLLIGPNDDDIAERAMSVGAAQCIDWSVLTRRGLGRRLREAVGAWQAASKAETDLERVSSLLDGAPVGIFRISPDDRFLEVNPFQHTDAINQGLIHQP